MGSLMDTFLQNPLGNPLANKPVLQWFPSFGPTQFAVAGSLGHTALWEHLALGLAWPAAFAGAGLLIFRARTCTRTHHDRRAAGRMSAPGHAIRKHAPG
jgi:ABC-2 type transport system permease protein